MKEFIEELKYNQNVNIEKGLENRIDIDYVIERLERINNMLYDNGEVLLGAKKNIVNQIHNDMLVNEEDELYMQVLEDLKDYEDDTIIALNYDNGMGYSIDYWDEKDKIGADK